MVMKFDRLASCPGQVGCRTAFAKALPPAGMMAGREGATLGDDLEREFAQEARLRQQLRDHEAELADLSPEALLDAPDSPLSPKRLPLAERQRWVAQMVADDVNDRVKALWALQGVDDPGLIRPLLDALTDAHPEVRRYAAANLALFADVRVREALVNALADPSPRVRCAASTALLALADQSCVTGMLAALQDDQWYVRYNCILALGMVGEPLVIPTLEAILLDPLDDCSDTAAEALGDIGDPVAVPSLALAMDHPQEQTRASAAAALGLIGTEGVVAPLARGLKDAAASVRAQARASLKELDWPAAKRALDGAG
jgi:HEAT repeat protein